MHLVVYWVFWPPFACLQRLRGMHMICMKNINTWCSELVATLIMCKGICKYEISVKIQNFFTRYLLCIYRMVFGSALFVAWGAAAMLILASLLACIACCGSDDDANNRRQPYTYKADRVNTVSKTMTEYV